LIPSDVRLDENRDSGAQTVLWNGRNADDASVSTGIYFYRLQVGNIVRTKKLVLLK
jgi:hypothetical protein